VGGDHSLDLWRAHAPFEASDRATVLDQHERRNLSDLQALDPVRLLVGVQEGDAKPGAFLPRQVGQETFHAASRAGPRAGEEEEDRDLRGLSHIPEIPSAPKLETPGRGIPMGIGFF
jgi:hypothetical protein